jgi:hypothetical protein
LLLCFGLIDGNRYGAVLAFDLRNQMRAVFGGWKHPHLHIYSDTWYLPLLQILVPISVGGGSDQKMGHWPESLNPAGLD